MLSASEVIHTGSDLFLAGAIIGCAYLLVAAVITIAFERREDAAADPVPVTVLVPLCGSEPDLVRRLTALCQQDYAAPIQIVCGLQSSADPALEAVKTAAAMSPCKGIEWYVDPRLHGRNRKMSNLINDAQHARHDMFIMIDSDIEVGARLSRARGRRLAGAGRRRRHLPLSPASPAAGCGPTRRQEHNAAFPAGRHRRPEGAPGGALLRLDHRAHPRQTLERIGGLQAFADQLWDDYAIGQAIRAAGLRGASVRR